MKFTATGHASVENVIPYRIQDKFELSCVPHHFYI